MTSTIEVKDGYIIKTYSSGTVEKTLISDTIEYIESEPQTTIEEQILAENQYQTALLEMQMLGGTV